MIRCYIFFINIWPKTLYIFFSRGQSDINHPIGQSTRGLDLPFPFHIHLTQNVSATVALKRQRFAETLSNLTPHVSPSLTRVVTNLKKSRTLQNPWTTIPNDGITPSRSKAPCPGSRVFYKFIFPLSTYADVEPFQRVRRMRLSTSLP